MTNAEHDPRVDAYIYSLPTWQQEVCEKIRKLIHDADPEVQETIKRTRIPYFVLNGNLCALMATKDHVNIFIYDPAVPDPAGLINQGHSNTTAQAIQVWEKDSLNEAALLELFKSLIARNRAGGWRKLQS